MDSTLPTTIEDAHAAIGALMPVALDMVASVVDNPGQTLDSYQSTVDVAAAESPLLLLAVLRVAAGLAAISELSGDEVRQLDPAGGGGVAADPD